MWLGEEVNRPQIWDHKAPISRATEKKEEERKRRRRPCDVCGAAQGREMSSVAANRSQAALRFAGNYIIQFACERWSPSKS